MESYEIPSTLTIILTPDDLPECNKHIDPKDLCRGHFSSLLIREAYLMAGLVVFKKDKFQTILKSRYF